MPMNEGSDHAGIKVFFAIWPNAAERTGLKAWLAKLKDLCGGRAMRIESLHATLVFIGLIERGRLEALQLAAQEVAAEDFELEFDIARYWGHNHIVYASPSGVPQQLTQLVESLEESLTRHLFKFDKRAYKPHVTLLRNARWTDEPLPAMPQVRWRVSDFALVQSTPQEYRVLATFPLNSHAQATGG